MITLYAFGRGFGLPDPSAFVSKAEVLLKMAGLGYETDTTGFRRAPKGKLPYISDDGLLVADSALIRRHIERKYGFDFDKGLTREQKSIGYAVAKMCEGDLYWAMVEARWMIDENFAKGPSMFFNEVPAALRPLIVRLARRQVRKQLHAEGTGRHPRAEIEYLATSALDAVSGVLGDKPWIVADEPCGADASIWSFVASARCPHFGGPIADGVNRHPNLAAYVDRGFARWFPELSR